MDAVSGEKRWRFKTTGEVISAAAVVDGTVYVTARDGPLHAVDVKTGQEKWHYGRAFGSPVVSAGLVCVAGRKLELAVGVSGRQRGYVRMGEASGCR